MRITNNMVTSSILAELQGLESSQATLQGQVSSGLAVSQPSDDPQSFAQVVQLESQNRQLQQFAQNQTQALNVANASYGGLNSLQQLYDRASQLGALGSGADLTSTGASYATEVDQLIQQTVQVANSQLGNSYIYGGTATGTPPFVASTTAGSITSVAYMGNSSNTAVPISANSTVVPGTSGATNSGIADFINNLVSLRDALNSGSSDSINAANTALTASENVITNAVADNGAVQARIQADQAEQQATSTRNTSMISTAADDDLPSTEVKLSQVQLAYQAALQSASSVMHLSILNYIQLN